MKRFEYIAVYSIIAPPTANLEFFSNEDIDADSDEEAIELAEARELTLNVIANNRPGYGEDKETPRIIMLNSIRNQFNRRTIYATGYTVDE